jgi:hypothetical protein
MFAACAPAAQPLAPAGDAVIERLRIDLDGDSELEEIRLVGGAERRELQVLDPHVVFRRYVGAPGRDPGFRVLAGDGRVLFRVTEVTASGTGLYRSEASWYEMTGGRVDEVLRVVDDSHAMPNRPIRGQVSTEVSLEPSLVGARAVRVTYRFSFGLHRWTDRPFPGGEEDRTLLSLTAGVIYGWDPARRAYATRGQAWFTGMPRGQMAVTEFTPRKQAVLDAMPVLGVRTVVDTFAEELARDPGLAPFVEWLRAQPD